MRFARFGTVPGHLHTHASEFDATGHHVPLRFTWCYRKLACSARLKKQNQLSSGFFPTRSWNTWNLESGALKNQLYGGLGTVSDRTQIDRMQEDTSASAFPEILFYLC